MKVIVIFGPPGAGKGTQCDMLVARLGVTHVSTGGILRSEIASGSDLGKKVKDVVSQGALVDDSLLFSCLESYLSRLPLSNGTLLLDGVPRTSAQIGGLDDVLKRNLLGVSRVVALTAPLDSLVSRFAKRFTCSCGFVGSFATLAEANSSLCPKCAKSGNFIRRADDDPEVVKRRMEVYLKETEPVARVFGDRGLMVSIDALRPVEEVYLDVGAAVLGR